MPICKHQCRSASIPDVDYKHQLRGPDRTFGALHLVNRAFDPSEPDQLWVMDVTEHPTDEGKVYLAVVLDAFSRMVIGWSIAEHMRQELVVDALQMAIWRRRPAEQWIEPTGRPNLAAIRSWWLSARS